MTPHEADRLLHEAMMGTSLGLDLDVAAETLDDALLALRAMARTLKEKATAPDADLSLPALAKAMGNLGKVVDEVVRMVAFVKSHRESGGDHGTDWLRALTAEQMAIVQGWVEANETK